MKHLITILILLIACGLFAQNDGTCLFTSFEPSGINRGMGYRGNGVANIWHNNPLVFYSNPDLSALHEGLSYGYRHENWLKGSGYEDIYYDTGLISFGYKGIAIMLPAPNEAGNFGHNIDYGLMSYTSEDGFEITGTFNPVESAQVYGLAINAMDWIFDRLYYRPYLDHFDLAVGVNLLQIRSNITPPSQTQNSDYYRHPFANSLNTGCLFKGSFKPADNVKLEGAYGLAVFNANKDKIKYSKIYPEEMIYRHINQGFSTAITATTEKPFQSWFLNTDNIFSIRFLASTIDNYNEREIIRANGLELSILDTVFIRQGNYDDDSRGISGVTKGYGINLHLGKIVSYSYNYSSVPFGGLVSWKRTADHSATIDFMELIDYLDR